MGRTLVMMAGLPGTGKTTIALVLGRRLRWPVCDKDTLKSPLLDMDVPEGVAGPASYALLFALATDVLVRQRLSVIIDSPAVYSTVQEQAHELACAAGARLKVIRCTVDPETRLARLAGRTARASQLTKDRAWTADEERALFAHLPADTLVLATTQPLAVCVAKALAYVRGVEAPASADAPASPEMGSREW
jgi:predicted kinase